jgi:8-amino-7-oxononanoate synthase
MALGWIEEELARLDREGLLRTRGGPIALPGPVVERGGVRLLNLCSNDYLSLASRPASGTTGSGASRLIVGEVSEHRALEVALAEWLGVEDALLFTSGYAANVGIVSALAGPGSVVVSDALNHASLIDGCRLSRARVVVTPHRDVAAVEAALRAAPESRRLVVTDGYFSMDATIARVEELRAVCDRTGAALYVDDAHSFGVFGPAGRGVCAAAGIIPDVWMGTLGKSFGSAGAFVGGSRALIAWLWNAARSFVFSTGLAPSAATAGLSALAEIKRGDRTAALLRNAAVVRERLGALGEAGRGPIVPIVVGEAGRAMGAMRALLERGIFVQAIRPPTVPRATSRLRLTVQAGHDASELEAAAGVVASVLR